jgi:ABC-type lipoprotein release transport system permease subunit
VFVVQTETIFVGAGFALLIGLLASIVPLYRAMNTSIVDGLRHLG